MKITLIVWKILELSSGDSSTAQKNCYWYSISLCCVGRKAQCNWIFILSNTFVVASTFCEQKGRLLYVPTKLEITKTVLHAKYVLTGPLKTLKGIQQTSFINDKQQCKYVEVSCNKVFINCHYSRGKTTEIFLSSGTGTTENS